MSRKLIATFVGALILFIWQFLSWAPLQVHGSQTEYTPQQEKLLAAMEGLPEGDYLLPTVPPSATAEERETLQTNMVGKPWALVQYHKSFNMSMGMNMARGMAANLVAVFLLVWLFSKFRKVDLPTALCASLAVGFIGYFSDIYIYHVWFETNTWPEIIDIAVQWGLVGIWLGVFLKD